MQVAAASLVAWTTISMLNCANISATEHTIPDAFQKARKKGGKRPLVSYHTIRVDLDKTPRQVSAESLPGDSTMPRLHKKAREEVKPSGPKNELPFPIPNVPASCP